MGSGLVEVSGRVVREHINPGSKSERDAVVLRAPDGALWVLRRQGGPAYGDTELDALVGRSIAAHGYGVGRTLILHGWRPLD